MKPIINRSSIQSIFLRTIVVLVAFESNPSLSFNSVKDKKSQEGMQLQKWDGPTTGPTAQASKTVVYIASDFKNGGVTAVYRGFEEAARKLDWNIRYEDGGGNKMQQTKKFSDAIAGHPDGIILSGHQAKDFPELVSAAKKAKIVLVGWHSAAQAGPTKDLFVNITTNASDVANLAAKFVIRDGKLKKKKIGVIIFNDNQYAIANLKMKTMKNAIEKCEGYKGCKVLSVENILISEADNTIPAIVPKLIATYGNAWTYSLAINDVYFDPIHFPLLNGKRTDIVLVSAGDGSERAINRIGSGLSEQAATIAEPLRMQGFQIADELNRAFAGRPPSGYTSKPLLITTESLKTAEALTNTSLLDYEASYSSIWNKKSK